MPYKISHIAQILDVPTIPTDTEITELIIDSRKITYPAHSLFFALVSDRRDGHDFIASAYQAGVRAFVVSKPIDETLFPDAVFLVVADTLAALQQLAGYHRSQFSYPVIGITGKVTARPAGTENPGLATGGVEVEASELEIHNISDTPPFPLDDAGGAKVTEVDKTPFQDAMKPVYDKILPTQMNKPGPEYKRASLEDIYLSMIGEKN